MKHRTLEENKLRKKIRNHDWYIRTKPQRQIARHIKYLKNEKGKSQLKQIVGDNKQINKEDVKQIKLSLMKWSWLEKINRWEVVQPCGITYKELTLEWRMKTRCSINEKLFHTLNQHACQKPACGQHDKRILQFDHIDSDGYADRRRFKANTKMKMYYIAHPDEAREKLQVLCCSCNLLKRFENNEWSWHRGDKNGDSDIGLESVGV